MITELKNQQKGPILDMIDTLLKDLGHSPTRNEMPGFLDPSTSEKGDLDPPKTQGLGDSE
jgi:hypothetical protein